MSRRLQILALAVGLSASAVAGTLAFRTALVAWAVEQQLGALGVTAPALKVDHVGWGETRFAELRAGQAGELEIAGLAVAYRPWTLLAGQLDRVTVTGAVLQLDLTGRTPPFGGLQTPLDRMVSEAGGGAAQVEMPALVLERAKVRALTPAGPAILDLDGRVQPGEGGAMATELGLALSGETGRLVSRLRAELSADGRLSGRLAVDRGRLSLGEDRFSVEADDGELAFALSGRRIERLDGELALTAIRLAGADVGPAMLRLTGNDARLLAEASLGKDQGTFELRARASLDDPLGAPLIDTQLELSATAEAPIWRLLERWAPRAGRGRVTLALHGQLPDLAAREPVAKELIARISESRLDGNLLLALDGVEVPGLLGGVGARLPVDVKLAQGTLELAGRLDAEVDTAGLPARWLAAAGLPEDAIGKRAAVEFRGIDGERSTVRLTSEGGATTLVLSGTAAVQAGDHLTLSATGELRGGMDSNHRLTTLAFESVELSAKSQGLAGTDLAGASFAGRLSGALARRGSEGDTAAHIVHEVALEAGTLALRLGSGETTHLVESKFERLGLKGAVPAETGFQGQAVLENGQAMFPDLGLVIDGVSATAPLGAEGLRGAARFSASAIRDLNDPPRFHPLTLAGELEPRDGSLDLRARAQGPRDAGTLAISGRIDPAQSRGRLRGVLAPLEFAPGVLEPAVFSPWLAGLDKVSGRMEGDARLAWGPAGLDSKAAIGLSDLSFESGGVTVRGLRMGLHLDDLISPSSPPSQILSVVEVDPGVPLEDVSVRFRVLPGEPPRILVERAQFSAAGGRYRVTDTVIDPSQAQHRIGVEVIDLELAELFDAIEIEGLKASGRIGGTVPMIVGPDGVVVADAELAERAPGILQFQSAVAAKALESGGEPVALLLDALEDFHYETLKVTAAKDADGELRLGIALLGVNPEVLEGRPFRLNINLTGNLDPLLAALLQGRRLTSDLLRETWRLRP